MASLNVVHLIGNLGQDPEVRTFPSGGRVVNVSLATSERWKDKQTGEAKEETQWHRLVAYERTAEVMAEYLKKGSKIYIEGRIKYGKYVDKNDIERYTTDIVVQQMKMLDSKPQGEDRGRRDEPRREPSRDDRTPGQRSRAPAPAPKPDTGFDDMDDDIPF